MTEQRPIKRQDLELLYDMHVKYYIEAFNESVNFPNVPFICACWFGGPGKPSEILALDMQFVKELHNEPDSISHVKCLIEAVLHHGQELLNMEKTGLPPRADPPDVVLHSSEAHTTTLTHKGMKKEQVLEKLKNFNPSDYEDRTEALVILLHTRDNVFFGMCPIKEIDGRRTMEYGPINFNARPISADAVH